MKINAELLTTFPNAAKFLDGLEFRVEGKPNASLFVAKKGFREGNMKAYGGSRVLQHYGITAWPYEDGDGRTVTPQAKAPEYPHHELVGLFGANGESSREELHALQAAFVEAAKASPVVQNYVASEIDLEALHTYDCCAPTDHGEEYEWVAGSEPSSLAMKRFGREFPILVGLASGGSDVFEAAERGTTAAEAYDLLIRHVTEKGWTVNGDGVVDVDPVPRPLLERIRGMQFVIGPSGPATNNERLRGAAEAFNLARRLPPEYFPETASAFSNLADIADVIESLENWESAAVALDEGFGFGMKFSDVELKMVLADIGATKFAAIPKGIEQYRALIPMARYGIALAGHEDLVRRFVAGDFEAHDNIQHEVRDVDFKELKAALAAEGLAAVYGKAGEFNKRIETNAAEESVTSVPSR